MRGGMMITEERLDSEVVEHIHGWLGTEMRLPDGRTARATRYDADADILVVEITR